MNIVTVTLRICLFVNKVKMGKHLKDKRKHYKKRRKHKLKEQKRNGKPGDSSSGVGNEMLTCPDVPSSPVGASSCPVDAPTSPAEGKEVFPFQKDILFTSMIKFIKSKKRFSKTKEFFENTSNPLLLDPYRHCRSATVNIPTSVLKFL